MHNYAEEVPVPDNAPRNGPEPSADASLVNQAIRQLRAAIRRAELEPGARLRIDALQARFGLSSSPLREALNRLAAEGLVEAEERRGFRVKPVSIEEFLDLTRVRLLLEKEALKESMRLGDDEWEAGIIAAFHRMELARGRLKGAERILDDVWSARHRDFHASLIAACGSPILLELCANLFMHAERYRHISARFRKPAKNPRGRHQRLMDAVLARKPKDALAQLTEHIESNAEKVAEALNSLHFKKSGLLTKVAARGEPVGRVRDGTELAWAAGSETRGR